MTYKDLRIIAQKLAEIGSEMVDANESRKASPEEVLQSLEQIAVDLESVMSSIPAQENSEPMAPDAQPKNPSQVAKLEREVSTLTAKLSLQEREKLATLYAELYPENKFADKYDEAIKSEESNDSLTAKILAIEKFANESDSLPVRHAQTQSFSYQKMAKLARKTGNTQPMRSL